MPANDIGIDLGTTNSLVYSTGRGLDLSEPSEEEYDKAAKGIEEGDKVEIDFNTGVIKNITKNETYQAEPFPEFMQEMFKVGGLVEQTKVKLGLK